MIENHNLFKIKYLNKIFSNYLSKALKTLTQVTYFIKISDKNK